MNKKSNVQIPRRSTDDASLSYSVLEKSRGLALLAGTSMLVAAIVFALAASSQTYIMKTQNFVAGVPEANPWALPIVHWVNTTNPAQEDAKLYHVVEKYLRAMYSVDTKDFQLIEGGEQSKTRVNARVKDALAYIAPDTEEFIKASSFITESVGEYQKLSEARGGKYFLVDDLWADPEPSGVMTVYALGKFKMLPFDTTRRLEIEDLGYQIVTLRLVKSISVVSKDGDPINPEGWWIIRSDKRTATPEDMKKARIVRLHSGMKLGY